MDNKEIHSIIYLAANRSQGVPLDHLFSSQWITVYQCVHMAEDGALSLDLKCEMIFIISLQIFTINHVTVILRN